MDEIGNILNNLDINGKCREMKDETRLNEQARKMVDSLFNVLTTHTHYMDLRDGDIARREWTKTFVVNNITEDEIRAGIKIIRTSTPRQNITPLEFIALCRPKQPQSIPECHQTYIPLPKPLASRENALTELAKIKQLLR